jgi:hypothetical protein
MAATSIPVKKICFFIVKFFKYEMFSRTNVMTFDELRNLSQIISFV